MARVTGIDTSLTGTGIAHAPTGRCITIGKTGITGMPLLPRLGEVDHLVRLILTEIGHPDLALIELPAYSRSAGGAVERHGLWWLVARGLRDIGVPVAEINIAHRMRYATGKSQATKTVIVDAVARRWPIFETVGDDNRADAAVLAAMGADYLGEPLAVVPKTHREALEAVNWPTLNMPEAA